MRDDAAGSLSILADTVGDLTTSSNFWTRPRHNKPFGRSQRDFTIRTRYVASNSQAHGYLRVAMGNQPGSSPWRGLYFSRPQNGTPTTYQAFWPSTYANFAPRFGGAYQLTDRGRTVIRGGMGFYFDSSLSLATDLVNHGPLNVSEYKSARNAPFNAVLTFGFPPDLRLPLVKQWNASIEQAFSDRDVLSVGYIGSSSDNLIAVSWADRVALRRYY